MLPGKREGDNELLTYKSQKPVDLTVKCGSLMGFWPARHGSRTLDSVVGYWGAPVGVPETEVESPPGGQRYFVWNEDAGRYDEVVRGGRPDKKKKKGG